MDQVIDQVIDHAIDHVGTVCADDARMEKMYATIMMPLVRYTSHKLSWFVTAVQSLGCLIVLQTLLLILLVRDRCFG